jgi:hypothetical protein
MTRRLLLIVALGAAMWAVALAWAQVLYGSIVDVAILGATGPGQAYFDPLAFAPVMGVCFGTAGYEPLRGPGTTNLDFSVFRTFRVTERLALQIRFEAFNLTSVPHISNPGANVSSLLLNPDWSIKGLDTYTMI